MNSWRNKHFTSKGVFSDFRPLQNTTAFQDVTLEINIKEDAYTEIVVYDYKDSVYVLDYLMQMQTFRWLLLILFVNCARFN